MSKSCSIRADFRADIALSSSTSDVRTNEDRPGTEKKTCEDHEGQKERDEATCGMCKYHNRTPTINYCTYN